MNPVLQSEQFDRAAANLCGSFDRFERIAINLEGALNGFERSVDKLGRLLAMQAENDQRRHRGESMAYDEASFVNT
jgi:hypothetical protein